MRKEHKDIIVVALVIVVVVGLQLILETTVQFGRWTQPSVIRRSIDPQAYWSEMRLQIAVMGIVWLVYAGNQLWNAHITRAMDKASGDTNDRK